MRLSNHRASYDAPQSEIIDFQVETNFLNDSMNYSGSYRLGDTSVEEGYELL